LPGLAAIEVYGHFERQIGDRMVIGEKLRELRELKKLSQGDIEERTGMLRCYTSRVENGHTVPSLETLEKYARALEIPLYKIFYDGKVPKKVGARSATKDEKLFGTRAKERQELRAFTVALSKMNEKKRKLIFSIASQMAGVTRSKT
jgi:transcriptional regulator with XRE-family HTH domain